MDTTLTKLIREQLPGQYVTKLELDEQLMKTRQILDATMKKNQKFTDTMDNLEQTLDVVNQDIKQLKNDSKASQLRHT